MSQAVARSTANGSPQKRLQRKDGKAPGFSAPNPFIINAIDGTENQTVSSESRMNCEGFSKAFRDGQQTQAPLSQATNMSKAERSKVKSKVCEKRSDSSIWYRSAAA